MPCIIERAFQLARSGAFTDLQSLSKRLEQERYESVRAHLSGRSIQRQLRKLMEEALAEAPERVEPKPQIRP